ncbi:MAG: hypothetical protein KDK70_21670 [Myxococcales bacterium]|nr:hypothetical protein [Myxococcales bacterium]
MMLPRWRHLGLLALLVLGSCSASYRVRFEVTLAPGLDVPEGASVVAMALEYDGPLSSAVGGKSTKASADRRVYTLEEGVCCAPDPKVRLHAFLDLDGDGQWSEGEPHGADPRNPIVLRDPKEVFASSIEIAAP